MTGEFTTTYDGPSTSSADGHHFLFRGVVFPHRRAAPVSITYHRKRVIEYLEKKGVDLPITGRVHVQIEIHPSSTQRYDLDDVVGAIFQMLDGTTHTRQGVILESDAQIASVTAHTTGPPGIDELVYRTRMAYERLPREEQDKMFEAYLESRLRDGAAQVDRDTEGTAVHEIAVATSDRVPVSEIPEGDVQLEIDYGLTIETRVKQAAAAFARLPQAEQEKMIQAQRESWVRGEMGMGETSCATATPGSAAAAAIPESSPGTDTSSDTPEVEDHAETTDAKKSGV